MVETLFFPIADLGPSTEQVCLVQAGEAAVMIQEHFDPVRVLGCEPEEAILLFHGRAVTPGEAQAIAGQTYPWRHHLHDPDSYWVTAGQAAAILQVPTQRVRRLLDQHRLPHIRHASGVRLMRRSEIEAAKDRYAKRSQSTAGTSCQ